MSTILLGAIYGYAILAALIHARKWYWQRQLRRTRRELDRQALDEVRQVIDAEACADCIRWLAHTLHDAGAIHPIIRTTSDGRHWRIEDGDVTEIEETT